MDDQKSSVEKEWAAISRNNLIKVCKAFRPKDEAMVKSEGYHFEV